MKTFIIAFIAFAVGAAGTTWLVSYLKSGSKDTAANAAAHTASDLQIVCSARISASGPEIALFPKIAGQVKAVKIKEGDRVQLGSSVLFELDDTMYRIKADGTLAAVNGAKAMLREAESEVAKVSLYKAMRNDAITVAQLTADAAKKTLEGLKDQASKNPQYALQSEIDVAEIRLKQAQSQENYERKQLALLEMTDSKAKVDQAQANLGAATAEYNAAMENVKDCIIKSPADGMILQIMAGVGTQVAPGSPMPLAILAPSGPVLVRAELDQEYLGKVVAGQRCTFKDESRADSVVWEGQVLSVNKQVRRPRSFLMEPGEVNDVRTVEVVIEPIFKTTTEELVLGQRVRVRFGKIE